MPEVGLEPTAVRYSSISGRRGGRRRLDIGNSPRGRPGVPQAAAGRSRVSRGGNAPGATVRAVLARTRTRNVWASMRRTRMRRRPVAPVRSAKRPHVGLPARSPADAGTRMDPPGGARLSRMGVPSLLASVRCTPEVTGSMVVPAMIGNVVANSSCWPPCWTPSWLTSNRPDASAQPPAPTPLPCRSARSRVCSPVAPADGRSRPRPRVRPIAGPAG